MASRDLVMSAAGNAGDSKTYVEDVFSTYLYTGNGSTQTINNGIDLAGKGGMVWMKGRNQYTNNWVIDTANGVNKGLVTNGTSTNSTTGVFGPFNSNGFTLPVSGIEFNDPTTNCVSWTFRKAPKFFDVVTYTGNGVAGRQISHSLGAAPGMMIIKCTSTTSNWAVYHRSLTGTQVAVLNLSNAAVANTTWNNTEPTSSQFTVGTSSLVNTNGATYVAYLFAHNAGGFGAAGTDNVISCGSFTPSGTADISVSLGYEPQYVLIKSTANSGWYLYDNMRGMSQTQGTWIQPNSSGAEAADFPGIVPTATGFIYKGVNVGLSDVSCIYMAIRRPMKVPTDGTKVFQPVAQTPTTTQVNLAFAPDATITTQRSKAQAQTFWFDRLRGVVPPLETNQTFAESVYSISPYGINMTSNGFVDSYMSTGQGISTSTIYWNFKRAPGFFDVVCYTGNGAGFYDPIPYVNHNLGVVPELVIFKRRNSTGGWTTYCSYLPVPLETGLSLNTTQATSSVQSPIQQSAPTGTQFVPVSFVNFSGATYVAYLFASCPGVSKVGSYTGNGTSQTINCGFTNGARFVLIKKTSSIENWYVWDSARGITSGNDPFLLLNTMHSEYTSYDTIDPDPSGFIVNQEDLGQNSSGASYIYLAIA